MYSHTYVLTNTERIFSAKSFSLENLSFLTNFKNFSTVLSRVSQPVGQGKNFDGSRPRIIEIEYVS